ncbi:subtilase family protein [Edaphobacter aggregans]|uniref:Subtilase family protein n=1 Tax=Edaphobacter aggregans TaxID=570835 RepID=A0A3R9QBA4_9BACT|nr:S53 family peptidase [Edaphobacter aggregans]RSL17119.1 subtilase family protein [Edaphobacter aggregans]
MRLEKGLSIVFAALVCAGLVNTAALAAEKAAVQARAAAGQNVQFDVYLPLQHKAELDALLDNLHDSTSASFHQWLTPAQFHARFGASAATVAAVQHELEAYGLTTQVISPQQIHVSGDASSVEQALLTQVHVGTFKNGKKTMVAVGGISLPSTMASNGAVVTGLSGFIRMRSHAKKLEALPTNRYSEAGPYWFDDLKEAYSYPSYQVYNGKGVTIGILMSGGFNPPDMAAYFGHEKLAVPHMTTVNIAGGAPYDPNDSLETHLDLQQTGGMAPAANLILYNLPDLSDANIISGLITIIETNKADVVSMSFGGPEIGYLPAYNDGVDFTGILGVYDDVFKQGATQGITFVASSGDLGALDVPAPACFDTNATSTCGGFLESAETPASSPNVTGVGGTNLVTTMTTGSLDSKYVSEAAFGDPLAEDIFYGTPATGAYWGSGGGNSIYYKKPTFQKLVTTGSKFRTVPDVSLQMGGCPIGSVTPCGPDRSAAVVAIGGGLFGVVGTSISAPDFAGLTALKIQRLGTRLGNENFDIYTLAALQSTGLPLNVYRENIQGYNGLFTTKKGYNRVLGNGTVNGVNFLLAPFAPVAGTPQTPSNP